MEENRNLRERGQTVEVTGPQRHPIYASGQLAQDGCYSLWRPTHYRVNLSAGQDECRLSDLRNLEVWICGTKQEGQRFYHLYQNCYVSGSQAVLGIAHDFPPINLWVELGWTFEELARRNLNFDRNRHNLLYYICETLPRADPNRVCKFQCLYEEVERILPSAQSIPGAVSPDVLARNRDAVLAALIDLRRSLWSNLEADFVTTPAGDNLMQLIRHFGVDFENQGFVRRILINIGYELILCKCIERFPEYTQSSHVLYWPTLPYPKKRKSITSSSF